MEAVKHARKRAGLTQTQLATGAGTTQAHISRIEAGTVAPSIELLAEIARACGCDLQIILKQTRK